MAIDWQGMRAGSYGMAADARALAAAQAERAARRAAGASKSVTTTTTTTKANGSNGQAFDFASLVSNAGGAFLVGLVLIGMSGYRG
jgi:hypothetical protein